MVLGALVIQGPFVASATPMVPLLEPYVCARTPLDTSIVTVVSMLYPLHPSKAP